MEGKSWFLAKKYNYTEMFLGRGKISFNSFNLYCFYLLCFSIFSVLVSCEKKVPGWINFEQTIQKDGAFVSAIVPIYPSISLAQLKCETEAKSKLRFVIQAELNDIFENLIKQNQDVFIRRLSYDLGQKFATKAQINDVFVDEKNSVLYCRVFLRFDKDFYISVLSSAENILKSDFPESFSQDLIDIMKKRIEKKRGIKLF